MVHPSPHRPLRELNGPLLRPSLRLPKKKLSLRDSSHKEERSPRDSLELLDSDCLAEIARHLEPCVDLFNFHGTSKACRDGCAMARAEHATLRRRGYNCFKLPAEKDDARPAAEPASRLSIAAVSLRSVRGPEHVIPSHLAVCDAQHGGIELVSLVSQAYERWGRLPRALSGYPAGVVVTPKCLRVGSGAEARVECEGLTFTILDQSASLLKTDGDVVLQRITLTHLLGDSAAVGPARLGPTIYVASRAGIVGVDAARMRIKTRTELPRQFGSICGIAAAPNGQSDASVGYVFLLDSDGFAHVFSVSNVWDVSGSQPRFISAVGRRDLKPPVTAMGAGVIQKELRLVIADCGGTRLNVFRVVHSHTGGRVESRLELPKWARVSSLCVGGGGRGRPSRIYAVDDEHRMIHCVPASMLLA